MKRILCIVGGMNPGGAETFLMKIYRTLDKNEFQMDFAVGVKKEGYYDSEIIEMGGKVFHITPKSEGFFRNFYSIRDLVRNENYKYVLRTSQHSLSALELLAAKQGGATVRAFRSSNTNTTSAGGKDLMLHKICSFMPNLFANVRLAPSTEAAEYMFGKNSIKKGKANLLHNGVDLSIYKYSEDNRASIRKEFNLQDKLVVGHVGRFSAQKNHEFLIDIFKRIHDYNQNAVLFLAGDGELRDSISEKAEKLGIGESVVFAGIRSDIPAILSAFDVFLFPSFYEGMPNTVIEAQATGLPCVISDTITKEANITNLVKYMSLSESVETWAESTLDSISTEGIRQNTQELFIENKYDILSVTNEFLRLMNLGGD